MMDIVLRGGWVVDGSGCAPYRADIGIVGDRIAAVGAVTASGRDEIDVGGLVVAPGFIDTHGHSDYVLSVCPQATSHLVQGYTTQVVGNCGFSVFPLYPENRGLFLEPAGLDVTWNTMDQWIDVVGAIGINAVPLVGHNTIRQLAVGGDVPATPGQIRVMQERIAEALDMGAFGFSTGLTYEPSTASDADEIGALLSVVAEYGAVYATHLRSYSPKSIWPAVEEALSLSYRAGVPVVLSHLVLHAPGNRGAAEPMLAEIDGWRRRGLRVHADTIAFPKLGPWWAPSVIFRDLYDAGLPWPEAADRLAERIRTEREKMRAAVALSLAEPKDTFWGQFFSLHGWDTIELVGVSRESPRRKDVGRTLSAIAAERGMDPVDLLFELIEEERGELVLLSQLVQKADHDRMARDPYFMFGSDLRVTAPDAVRLPGVGGPPDERQYGEAIEILSRLVRERGVLTLTEAIRKLTSLPADCFGIRDRGRLVQGLAADVCVFDFFRLQARGSVKDPHAFPEGIHHVLVNGRFALKDRTVTGELTGRVLRRS